LPPRGQKTTFKGLNLINKRKSYFCRSFFAGGAKTIDEQ